MQIEPEKVNLLLNIDFVLLAEQKHELMKLESTCANLRLSTALEGAINLISGIQDQAVAQIGAQAVYNLTKLEYEKHLNATSITPKDVAHYQYLVETKIISQPVFNEALRTRSFGTLLKIADPLLFAKSYKDWLTEYQPGE